DVRALDYDPAWTRREFLEPNERDWIGAQVAHLTLIRREKMDWPVVGMADRAFDVFDSFCTHVARVYPDRQAWLRHGWREVQRRRESSAWQQAVREQHGS